jgi:hypothetical protein
MKVLISLIATAAAKVNVQYNMNVKQVSMCAEEIFDEMKGFTLKEIETCLIRGCRGHYGELFNRFDQTVIFGWMRKFMEENRNSVSHLKVYE